MVGFYDSSPLRPVTNTDQGKRKSSPTHFRGPRFRRRRPRPKLLMGRRWAQGASVVANTCRRGRRRSRPTVGGDTRHARRGAILRRRPGSVTEVMPQVHFTRAMDSRAGAHCLAQMGEAGGAQTSPPELRVGARPRVTRRGSLIQNSALVAPKTSHCTAPPERDASRTHREK